jgi:large subunit ribosomal protein LX
MRMAQVRVFRIEGKIEKPGYKATFTKELRAVTEKEALEKVYSVLGGGEKVKRFQITIKQIKEIDPSEATDPDIRELSGI